jgi:hypothetical protein
MWLSERYTDVFERLIGLLQSEHTIIKVYSKLLNEPFLTLSYHIKILTPISTKVVSYKELHIRHAIKN